METLVLSDRCPGDIQAAGAILRRGGLVAIPTETVYGLAANALDGDAVKKIYRAKGRPSDNPLIVHISRFSQLAPLVREVPESAQKLAAAFCGHANVISLPCKGLAEMVERGIFDGPVLDAYLQDLLLPFRYCNIDYIVLGCTHYPFVRKAIARNFGRPVSIIDGSEGTARQLRRQLEAASLLTDRTGFGTVTFQNSRPDKLAMSQTLFQMKY